MAMAEMVQTLQDDGMKAIIVGGSNKPIYAERRDDLEILF